MASGSETTRWSDLAYVGAILLTLERSCLRWSDLATCRDLERDSEYSSLSDSLLSKVLEHAVSNLSVRQQPHLKTQQKTWICGTVYV